MQVWHIIKWSQLLIWNKNIMFKVGWESILKVEGKLSEILRDFRELKNNYNKSF